MEVPWYVTVVPKYLINLLLDAAFGREEEFDYTSTTSSSKEFYE